MKPERGGGALELTSDAATQPSSRAGGCFHIPFEKSEIEQSIVARFEQQVSRYSERVALRTRTEELTYGALNRLANQIARSILAAPRSGTGPVALLFEPGAFLFASMLGTLKASRFYVPLDPSHPPARISRLLADARADLFLTDAAHVSQVPEMGRVDPAPRRIIVDEMNAGIPADNLNITISPDAAAYILHTSGSTGQPKGVLQTHRSVLHNVRNYTNAARLHAGDRLSLLSPCSFGASVSDIYGALLNGAALLPFAVRDEGLIRLKEWLLEERITIYHSVPTLFRHLAAVLTGDERYPDLRLIKLGGEPVLRRDVEQYREHFPEGCRLYVGLGATEMNVIRCFLMDQNTVFEGAVAPVGYAVDGVEILLLDADGAPVALGTAGEIAIRSRFLSPGYWRQPELTQAAFRPDPHGGSERVYRTGDLGRMLPDGCLIHLGRKDSQVKIRGHRVEPAEVELALLEHPGIREAVVMAQDGPAGEPQLVAYIAVASGAAPAEGELRGFLRERLPDYMMPLVFVMLEKLPLTESGKIDRQSLPPPGTDPGRSELTGPRDSLERRLVEMWEEILSVRPVGARDNFFDRGGHSLLAARLLVEIERQFGRRLTPVVLLKAPTVRELAEVLRGAEPLGTASSLVPIQAAGSRPPFFCIHGVGGQLLGYRDLARHLGQDQPFYTLHSGEQDREQLDRTPVEKLAARYLHDLRAIQPEGAYFLSGFSFGGVVAFEMACQLHAEGQRVALLVLLDSYGPGYPRPLPLARRLAVHRQIFHQLPAREKLTYARERGREVRQRLAAVSSRIALRLGSNREGPLSGDRTGLTPGHPVRKQYVPRTYPGRMILFRAREQPSLYEIDPDLGWSGLAAGGLHVDEIPGGHSSILREPHVRDLAQRLLDYRDRALHAGD